MKIGAGEGRGEGIRNGFVYHSVRPHFSSPLHPCVVTHHYNVVHWVHVVFLPFQTCVGNGGVATTSTTTLHVVDRLGIVLPN